MSKPMSKRLLKVAEKKAAKNARIISEGQEEWRIASARISWALWLVKRRADTGVVDQAAESEAWQSEADEYRRYVRTVLRGLANEGIALALPDDTSQAKG